MSERQGTKCKFLIDTSALYPLLLSGVPLNAEDYAVSALTKYEIGNVLWKETRQGRMKNPQLATTAFSKAMQTLTVLELDSIANVLALAIERNLAFYDASYAYLAEKEGLKLVTQDTELLKKCKVAISKEQIL
ncbi:MAG: type II toxin-antitoxin system VapC family toxin [Candidatus Bathyarchaeota archaeon]|nr:type II toxin-antitoxin system VapC family toxin [Candidatus Bathyarchaeota archaeon]